MKESANQGEKIVTQVGQHDFNTCDYQYGFLLIIVEWNKNNDNIHNYDYNIIGHV